MKLMLCLLWLSTDWIAHALLGCLYTDWLDEQGDADQLIPSAEASVNKAGPTVEVAFSATVYVDSNCIVWCLVVRGV